MKNIKGLKQYYIFKKKLFYKNCRKDIKNKKKFCNVNQNRRIFDKKLSGIA